MDYIKDNWKEIILNIFIMFVVFLIGFFSHYFWSLKQDLNKKRLEEQKEKKQLLIKQQKEEQKKKKKEKFQALNLRAKAVLVKEYNGEEIYSKNKNKILPIASLTKIVNAIVALEKYPERDVVMTKRALAAEGNYGLKAYEIFKPQKAVEYMLIGSINDLASAISFGPNNITKNWIDFISEMKSFTEREKLDNTLFFSENGLNIANHIMGAYSTAEDVSKIVEYFYDKFPDLAKNTVKIEADICSDKHCHYVKNTNLLLEKYPEIKFSKTGYTKKAGGSLAVVLEINSKKYTVVILGSGKQERFDDLEKIINLLKNNSF